MKLLKFSHSNSKLKKLEQKLNKKVYSFSILSGISCPGASLCKAHVIQTKDGLRVKDGPKQEFRCFSASNEAVWTNVYKTRKYNLDLVKGKNKEQLIDLISKSLPVKAEVIRIHVAGDFINQDYFDSWIEVAKSKPKIIFYAYTKSLPFWIKRLKEIPKNLFLTASVGGRYDSLIQQYKLKNAEVIMDLEEAKKKMKEVDWDDSHAIGKKSFLLALHGQQKAKSNASTALQKVIKQKKELVGVNSAI